MKNVIMILIVVAALGGAAYVMQGKLGMGEEAMSERISELQLNARGYRTSGEYQKSIPLLEEAVELSRKYYDDAPSTALAVVMRDLATDYIRVGRYEDAIPLLEEVIHMRIEVSGNDAPETFRARRLLDEAKKGASGG